MFQHSAPSSDWILSALSAGFVLTHANTFLGFGLGLVLGLCPGLPQDTLSALATSETLHTARCHHLVMVSAGEGWDSYSAGSGLGRERGLSAV